MQVVAIFLFRHGQAFEHQHDRAAGGANIDRLVRGVQHQHRSLHDQALARRGLLWLPIMMMLMMTLASGFVPFMHWPVFLPIRPRRAWPSPANSPLPGWRVRPWPPKPVSLLLVAARERTRWR